MMVTTGFVAGVAMRAVLPRAAEWGSAFGAALEAAGAGVSDGSDADIAIESDGEAEVFADPSMAGVAMPDPVALVVMPAPPPAIGGWVGDEGVGLVVDPPISDTLSGSLAGVRVPAGRSDDGRVAAGLGPAPRPSPRTAEGVRFDPALAVAPAAVAMRDVSALLAGQPGVVMSPVAQLMTTPPVIGPTSATAQLAAVVAPVAQADAPAPVGVAEAAIREQVAALIDDRGGDTDVALPMKAGGDTILATSVVPGLPQVHGTPSAAPSAAPVLAGDAALALHVDAARQGAALDAIGRDIVAGGDAAAPMQFRIDTARMGPVTIDLSGGIAALAVRMTTQGPEARDRIAEAETRLVNDARAAGVQIASVQVIDKPAEARRETAQSGGQPGGQHAEASGHGAGGQGSQPGQGGGAGRQSHAPPRGRLIDPVGSGAASARPSAASELYA
ncbi:flagellar hook-length control protein FliK [Sphingomonas montana]|uniref:flagellar hook-length control protein FliK n=1 Tax=Sphingomonas montana TaxID=1843236 RepID=UPI00096CA6A8|nr:flagellar hook-length control protein FliK [Sphingomonas montana]